MSNRDVGILEAVDTLLSQWLTKIEPDTHIKFINTYENKKRRLKTRKELEMDPSSTNIFAIDFVDDRYPRRPDDLEMVSLRDLVRTYDVAKLRTLKRVLIS